MLATQTDASFLDGALRETEEELGIRPEEVQVLGEIGPPEVNLRGDMRVWPYIVRDIILILESNDEMNV